MLVRRFLRANSVTLLLGSGQFALKLPFMTAFNCKLWSCVQYFWIRVIDRQIVAEVTAWRPNFPIAHQGNFQNPLAGNKTASTQRFELAKIRLFITTDNVAGWSRRLPPVDLLSCRFASHQNRRVNADA